MRLRTRNTLVALVAVVAAGLMVASARAAPPSNTSPPTVTGTEQHGKILTAQKGTWTNSPTSFHYRWQRCTADGTGCTNLDNAVFTTYTLRANDIDHTVRVVVTASNGDGQASAISQTTGVISAKVAPTNTGRPTITGKAVVGEELTASRGTWTGGARSYAYQWRRCDVTGEGCGDVVGATGSSYGVREADFGHTMRVVVTATNLAGSTAATSDNTGAVDHPFTPQPARKARVNHRPTISIIGVRFVGARVYTRFRACDDSGRNLNIPQRDSKRGVPSYTRRFRTLHPPRTCAALTRSWIPAPRFRHGRYVLTLWAKDFSGLLSRPASRVFFR